MHLATIPLPFYHDLQHLFCIYLFSSVLFHCFFSILGPMLAPLRSQDLLSGRNVSTKNGPKVESPEEKVYLSTAKQSMFDMPFKKQQVYDIGHYYSFQHVQHVCNININTRFNRTSSTFSVQSKHPVRLSTIRSLRLQAHKYPSECTQKSLQENNQLPE